MKNDLIFSGIALPFTIGFGMYSTQPIWALAVFSAMLLLRYAGAPASAAVARRTAPTMASAMNQAVRARLEKSTHFSPEKSTKWHPGRS